MSVCVFVSVCDYVCMYVCMYIYVCMYVCFFLDNLGFEFLSKWDCVPILVAFAVTNAFLVLLGLTFLSYERR